MQTIEHLSKADRFIMPGRRLRDLLEMFPDGVRRLLLVIDPADRPEPAIAIVLQLAARWYPHITLMHGRGLGAASRVEAKSDRDDLVDLLCLGWDLKNRYSEVSISRSIVRSWQQLSAEATERKADVILIPEELAAGYRQSPSGAPKVSDTQPFPCPTVMIAAPGPNWSSWCLDLDSFGN